MQLKSLELQGFKSFPDKTKINICPGMTVIVGPNGSGKSNISDAIRWVLGELSSKNMRGSKMEDVIFGGCLSRRPMGFAEVSLTFDNTIGEITLPVSYDEVCITRKFYRSGISEYMINRKPVRLRDITDLFMNTGLGKSGYSIIGQGRIAEIISKKSEDRRSIFEEAAGISRYRQQKNDAAKKLAEVDLNLNSAEILRNSLEEQLGPLEKQSIKAKKYTALRDEKIKVDVAVWLYEIDNVRNKAEELNNKCEIAQHEYDIADDSVKSLEAQFEKLVENSRETNHKLEETRAEIRVCTEQKHRYENEMIMLKSELSHLEKEFERLTSELEEIRKSGSNAVQQITLFDDILSKAEKELNDLRDNYTEAEIKLNDIRSKIAKYHEESEKCNLIISKTNETLVNTKLELSGLKASKNGNLEKRNKLSEQIATEKIKLEEQKSEILRNSGGLDEHISRLKKIEGQIVEQQEGKNRLEQKLSNLDDRKKQANINHSSLSQRIETLKRMEQHFEGFANAVRLVMQWSEKGFIDGICGPVSKLITLNPEYSTSIETALGGAVQNIVCTSDTAAKAAIAKLKAERGGIVTFYPINTVRPTKLNVDTAKLKHMEGFIGFANELIQFESVYQPVIDFLLSRTVICRDMDCASKIGKAFDYRFKIVTLDGQTVNAGGSFTGGSQKQNSGILSRRAEISSLEEKMGEIASELEEINEEATKTINSINSYRSKIARLESDKEIAKSLYGNAAMEQKLLEQRLTDLKNKITELENELGAIVHGEKTTKEKIEATEKDILSLEASLSELAKTMDEYKTTLDALEVERENAIETKNMLYAKITAASSRLDFTKKEIANAQGNASELAIKEKTIQTELAENKERKIKANEEIEEAEKMSAEISEKIALLDKTAVDIRLQADDFEKNSATIRGQIKIKTTHRENCFKTLTRYKEQAENVVTEQDKYISLLWDEYDLTYATASEMPHEKLTEDTKPAAIHVQTKLKRQMKELGDVNLAAIDEYATTKQRFEELDKQYQDLIKSKSDYENIVNNMEKQMKTLFTKTFNSINVNFKSVFSELFGGGTAELVLTDPENVLESGIEINVAPPGKIIKNLSLLSGGEQVFVAIALFFAILKVTPAPFCLLDEIEAALDEVNVARFAQYAKKYSDKTQFIVISHRRGTMEEADTLYGVMMQEKGISSLLSIHVNEVEEKLGIKNIK